MDSNGITDGLRYAPYALNIYLGLFLYITGVFGCFGNIIVYRSRAMSNRACYVYLLWASYVDLVYLHVLLLTRILMKGFRVAITSRYDFLCRTRQFFSNYGNELAFTFLALATLDRVLLSHRSPSYRQWGNRMPLVRKLIAGSFVLWFLVFCHRLIWYRTAGGGCGAQPGVYAYFDNIFDALVTCLLPMVTLTVLGVLVGRSIRSVLERRMVSTIQTTESTQNNQSVISKIDAQLTIMLFMEIIVSMISFLPYAAHLIYINVTDGWFKSPLRVAWETVIIELIRILSYLFFSCRFYVSILSISSFRHQFLRSIGLQKLNTDRVSQTHETTGMRATFTTAKVGVATKAQ